MYCKLTKEIPSSSSQVDQIQLFIKVSRHEWKRPKHWAHTGTAIHRAFSLLKVDPPHAEYGRPAGGAALGPVPGQH